MPYSQQGPEPEPPPKPELAIMICDGAGPTGAEDEISAESGDYAAQPPAKLFGA